VIPGYPIAESNLGISLAEKVVPTVPTWTVRTVYMTKSNSGVGANQKLGVIHSLFHVKQLIDRASL
jgi:hypothetical protein